MLEWNDVSSYSRGETNRVPRSYSARAGMFKLTVTRHINYPPDVWVIRSDSIGDEPTQPGWTAEEAQHFAEERLRDELLRALGDLGPEEEAK